MAVKFSKKVQTGEDGVRTIRLDADPVVVQKVKLVAVEKDRIFIEIPKGHKGLAEVDALVLDKAKRSSEAWFGRDIAASVIDAAYKASSSPLQVALSSDLLIYDAKERECDMPKEGAVIHVALEPVRVDIAKSDIFLRVEVIQIKVAPVPKKKPPPPPSPPAPAPRRKQVTFAADEVESSSEEEEEEEEEDEWDD